MILMHDLLRDALEAGMTRQQISDATGAPLVIVAKWEGGCRPMELEQLRMLSEALLNTLEEEDE